MWHKCIKSRWFICKDLCTQNAHFPDDYNFCLKGFENYKWEDKNFRSILQWETFRSLNHWKVESSDCCALRKIKWTVALVYMDPRSVRRWSCNNIFGVETNPLYLHLLLFTMVYLGTRVFFALYIWPVL